MAERPSLAVRYLTFIHLISVHMLLEMCHVSLLFPRVSYAAANIVSDLISSSVCAIIEFGPPPPKKTPLCGFVPKHWISCHLFPFRVTFTLLLEKAYHCSATAQSPGYTISLKEENLL